MSSRDNSGGGIDHGGGNEVTSWSRGRIYSLHVRTPQIRPKLPKYGHRLRTDPSTTTDLPWTLSTLWPPTTAPVLPVTLSTNRLEQVVLPQDRTDAADEVRLSGGGARRQRSGTVLGQRTGGRRMLYAWCCMDKGLRQDCVHDDVELRDFASSHAPDTLPGILAAHLGDLVTEAMVHPKFTGLLHLQPRGSIVGAAPRGHI
ncbi:hypothetical protein K466DRAFT_358678 [Polyporus arcularius HHB13444]|uniref:Uncharacterized protein n=1 Tax=Polyporus arcularius HHB13444 TaxID=1314778 RepID=A0A5C3PM91_9APHY|nr:hypothetical protein K466DRAFT_358678 [Polyporus arcularius HHB13444]